MACFLVPTAEAVIASIAKSKVAKSEEHEADISASGEIAADGKFTWKKKLSWLTTMLWGGALLLLLEHVWHGEVVFYPPFLTAMSNPADTATMLHEMATAGVGMAVFVTAVWAIMVFAADHVPAIRRVIAPGEEA